MSRKTVLIVDDVLHMRKLINHMLKRNLPVDCFEAKDGKEALSMILIKKPDLVLLDINMPIMDGKEVLKRVKESTIEAVQRTPIIMLTGTTDKSEVMEVLEMGIRGYVVKPINEPRLIELVKGVLFKKSEG